MRFELITQSRYGNDSCKIFFFFVTLLSRVGFSSPKNAVKVENDS